MSETFITKGESTEASTTTDVDPKNYGKNIDMSNPQKGATGPKLNEEIEGVFGRVPTYFGRVDLLVAAIGKLGDKALAKYLNEIVDSIDQSAADSSVQGRRDAQQAALDAEWEARRTAGYDFKIPDDPREAEISPIEAPDSSVVGAPATSLDDLAAAQGLVPKQK